MELDKRKLPTLVKFDMGRYVLVLIFAISAGAFLIWKSISSLIYVHTLGEFSKIGSGIYVVVAAVGCASLALALYATANIVRHKGMALHLAKGAVRSAYHADIQTQDIDKILVERQSVLFCKLPIIIFVLNNGQRKMLPAYIMERQFRRILEEA